MDKRNSKYNRLRIKIQNHCYLEHGIERFETIKRMKTIWSKITDAMKKKLNSDELFEYVRIHMLPAIIAEHKSKKTKPSFINSYSPSACQTPGKILKEVRA